jgi:hypothetical protein
MLRLAARAVRDAEAAGTGARTKRSFSRGELSGMLFCNVSSFRCTRSCLPQHQFRIRTVSALVLSPPPPSRGNTPKAVRGRCMRSCREPPDLILWNRTAPAPKLAHSAERGQATLSDHRSSLGSLRFVYRTLYARRGTPVARSPPALPQPLASFPSVFRTLFSLHSQSHVIMFTSKGMTKDDASIELSKPEQSVRTLPAMYNDDKPSANIDATSTASSPPSTCWMDINAFSSELAIRRRLSVLGRVSIVAKLFHDAYLLWMGWAGHVASVQMCVQTPKLSFLSGLIGWCLGVLAKCQRRPRLSSSLQAP